MYGLLADAIRQLPRSGGWTQDRRDRWLRMFTACVDLLVEVEPESSLPLTACCADCGCGDIDHWQHTLDCPQRPRCGDCGASMEFVRPGKWQCSNEPHEK